MFNLIPSYFGCFVSVDSQVMDTIEDSNSPVLYGLGK